MMLCILLITSLFLAGNANVHAREAQKLNILFIFADDWGRGT
jgi:hypothetical protein